MFIPDDFLATIELVDDVITDKTQPTFYVKLSDVVLMRKADSWNEFPTNEGVWTGSSYCLFIRMKSEACRSLTSSHTVQVQFIAKDRLSMVLRKKDLPIILKDEHDLYGQEDHLIEVDEMRIGVFTTQNEVKGKHRLKL